MKKNHRLFEKSRDQRGAVLVLVVGAILLLIGFVALAVDIGHLLVVRNELQNAADAAALNGAGYLYPQIPPASPSPPDWAAATTHATSAIGLNKSDATTLAGGTVTVGYWDTASPPTGSGATLKSTGITPGPTDFAAVQVTVPTTTSYWFARILGLTTQGVSAKATAVMASPGRANPGALLPVAITKAVADQKDSYTCPGSTFRVGSSYHYPSTEAGQWTSLLQDANNVPTIRGLLANGNPDPVSVGQQIWIQPGTKDTLYNEVPFPRDYVVPVIENITTHSLATVLGFVCFHVTGEAKGSDPYIEGCFDSTCYAGLTSGIGPNYGAYQPPRLVQ